MMRTKEKLAEARALMGIPDGPGYGETVDAVVISVGHNLDDADWLRLAWACIDQVSSSKNARLAEAAMVAVEAMVEALDGEPGTLRTGVVPDLTAKIDESYGESLSTYSTYFALTKDEESVILSIARGTLSTLPPERHQDAVQRLIDKGLVRDWKLTEEGENVARMAGAT